MTIEFSVLETENRQMRRMNVAIIGGDQNCERIVFKECFDLMGGLPF